MGLFDKLKKEDNKKTTAKPAKANAAKKVVAKPAKEEKAKSEEQGSMKDLYGGSETITVKTATGKEKHERKFGNAYRILVKPVITEKAAILGHQNQYVFAVTAAANKIEIAKAVNEVYGIKPVDVNIVKMRGKKVRSGKVRGARKSWKKAIITLPAGKTIKIYEGV